MKNPALPLVGSLVFAASMMLAGCNSAPPPRDLMAEEAHSDNTDRPVAMKGESTFAGGKIDVVATVARGFRREGAKAGGKADSGGKRRGGGGGGNWSKHQTDAFSEDYSFDYGDSEEEQKEAMQEYVRQAMARRAAGSPMPPVTLHVTFENRGTEPIEIVPTEVNSDLGNFAPRPAKLTLAPGEKGALDPMISQLGVTSDDIPLTISIRVGKQAESQVIHVKNILAPSLRK